jgi:hypothetical protein
MLNLFQHLSLPFAVIPKFQKLRKFPFIYKGVADTKYLTGYFTQVSGRGICRCRFNLPRASARPQQFKSSPAAQT